MTLDGGKEVFLAVESEVTRAAAPSRGHSCSSAEYMMQGERVAELARRFEISRKTAYKWIDRFLCGCELNDRPRRPHGRRLPAVMSACTSRSSSTPPCRSSRAQQ